MNKTTEFMSPNDIRHQFSIAMSTMYQTEVPLYSDLIDLVDDVNTKVMTENPDIKIQLENTGELDRLSLERHGAIRLGTADELATMRRLFAVMGMHPVGYYDLTTAGVPVHSTAFRAIDSEDLKASPFRLFTSLLRLDLIEDGNLKQKAELALSSRNIFTPKVIELIEVFEINGGLTAIQADEFIKTALETFRWHDTSPITKQVYDQLLSQHQLIADIVGFKGPHINHLTPRTLDIDAVQQGMQARGIPPKDIIEGPPRRHCPILLRQTSFKALEEAVNFQSSHQSQLEAGSHTARFGEIEQRGVALTPKGRQLYDQLLNEAKQTLGEPPNKNNADKYYAILNQTFERFPDDYQTLHDDRLAYFYYQPMVSSNNKLNSDDPILMNELLSENERHLLQEVETHRDDPLSDDQFATIKKLLNHGFIRIEPITYEDFLPVSAAGIFQSNLNDNKQTTYTTNSNKADFEQALGSQVYDELALYQKMQSQSLRNCLKLLNNLPLSASSV